MSYNLFQKFPRFFGQICDHVKTNLYSNIFDRQCYGGCLTTSYNLETQFTLRGVCATSWQNAAMPQIKTSWTKNKMFVQRWNKHQTKKQPDKITHLYLKLVQVQFEKSENLWTNDCFSWKLLFLKSVLFREKKHFSA